MIRVFRSGTHTGEEPWVPGNDRAGMIVLSGCHLRCSYCYTPETSRDRLGQDLTFEAFRFRALELKSQGARNLNLITPTHYFRTLEPWLRDLKTELEVPIILKVTGYESIAQIRRMAGVAQHLVFDFKVASAGAAARVNLPADYRETAMAAIAEAQRLGIESTVRHLLVPGEDDDSVGVVSALASISYLGRVNLMTLFARTGAEGLGPRLQRASNDRVRRLLALAACRSLRFAIDGKELHESIAA